jgi:hypothetical protein
MKLHLLICSVFIGVVLNTGCFAQQVYCFGYDSNGNRTDRTICLPQQLKSTSQMDSSENKAYSEVLNNLEITLYPNPTKGEITVVLKNFEGQPSSSITVYEYSGRILQTYNNIQESNVINLSELPRATYILRITAGERNTEWKVIKE